MKTLKRFIAFLLVLTLLGGCAAPNVEEGNSNDTSDGENIQILPDYDTDEDDEATPIIEPDVEDDGGVVPDAPSVEYSSQTVESVNDEFKLTLFNAKDRYTSDENIEIEATVSLIADEELTVTVWSGDPILAFSLSGDTCFNDGQGSGLTMDILMSNVFTNTEDYIYPYSKSGGWSGDDPYRDFYTDFFNDRDSIKLPAGNYTVTAYLSYSLEENDVLGTRRNLSASVNFTVEGKTLEDMGYFPKEAEEKPNQEVIVEDDVVVDVPESEDDTLTVDPLVNVNYPEMPEYPDYFEFEDYNEYEKALSNWDDAIKALNNVEGRSQGVDRFVAKSVQEILLSESEENTIYSPLNVYLALGMLAEIADGETRQQILNLVGEDSIESLRASVYALWCHNYSDDGRTTSLLGSSVWIDDRVRLFDGVGESLADNYYAESYNCDIGSPEMLETYKNWLNEHTGGLLKDDIEETEFTPETVLVMATTICYKAGWLNEFREAMTAADTFTLPDGSKIECDFLNGYADGAVYYSHNFSAATKSFADGGRMWLVLPNQGVTPAGTILDADLMELIISNGKDFERDYADVILKLPKFDVKSNISLNNALKSMGVTNAFDSGVSEFLIEADNPLFVSNVKHAARVKIDEEGVEAAAYTEIIVEAESAAEPPPVIEFTLDRPFVFAITSKTGDVLFVGVVNNPVAE